MSLGDAIAHRAAVGRERDNRPAQLAALSVATASHAQRTRGCAGVAGGIGGGSGEALRCPLASAAVVFKPQAPLPLAATLPNSVAPSNTLTVALASTMPLAYCHLCDAIAHRAAVGRERDNRRRGWRRCIDRARL